MGVGHESGIDLGGKGFLTLMLFKKMVLKQKNMEILSLGRNVV